MIVRPCSQAIVALTFSIYASKPFFPECEPPDEAVRYRYSQAALSLVHLLHYWALIGRDGS